MITLGFGVWHYAVPAMYKWFSYMPSIPDELRNGITAANFFLSTTLTLLGAYTLVVVFTRSENIKVHLIVMSILWLSRVVYQIVKPQGTMIPGLPMILICVFSLTALCFIIPLIMVWEK